jgi:hypothetical protein
MPDGTQVKLPLLERLGLAVLRRSPAHAPVAAEDDPIYVLNVDERRELRRIERRAVRRAATAGALSGTVSAMAAIWAHRWIGANGLPYSAADGVKFWSVVGAATLVASIFEIGFIYWDALRSLYAMATAAGLRLGTETLPDTQHHVALALARAALELPNPPERVFGVDPHREATRWLVVLASVLYKAKIAVTTFALKALLRTLLGQAAGGALLELATIPVTAVWNGIVCFLVVREARLRAMGPSAAVELVGHAFADGAPSAAVRAALLRSVASAIVRNRDLHPNLHALFHALIERLGPVDFEEVDDARRFVDELRGLDYAEQTLVLRLLVIAAVIDGRLTRRERRLLNDAFAVCGRPLPLERVERLRAAFYAGDGLDFELVRNLAA